MSILFLGFIQFTTVSVLVEVAMVVVKEIVVVLAVHALGLGVISLPSSPFHVLSINDHLANAPFSS